MFKSLMGEAEDVLYPGVSYGYRKAVLEWQARAAKLRKNVGYVPGSLMHYFHGKKSGRRYWDRCKILTDTKFDPTTDLKKDCEGLWQLNDDNSGRIIKLRDALRSYFSARNEDSTEA